MASDATIVGESSQEYLNRKLANASAVWQYFEKQDTEGQSKCLLCKTIVKHLSNTSKPSKGNLHNAISFEYFLHMSARLACRHIIFLLWQPCVSLYV